MTSRLFGITVWLAAGHALLFGLFWWLLAVPESNVAMRPGSALIALLIIVLFGWVEGRGLFAWRAETPTRQLPLRAIRAGPRVRPFASVVAVNSAIGAVHRYDVRR